jgi:hypothetical protein
MLRRSDIHLWPPVAPGGDRACTMSGMDAGSGYSAGGQVCDMRSDGDDT